MLKHLDLFSGIGGFSLGLEMTGGIKTVAFCENEPFCQKVLQKRWPHVPIEKDVTDTYEFSKYKGQIDILTAGFPCQPYSVAGPQKGSADHRAIWKEMCAVIEQVQPTFLLLENVSNIVRLELDNVLSRLEIQKYATTAFILPAVAVGALHRRDRCFIVGYSEHARSLATAKRRGTAETSHDNSQGTEAPSKSEGTSRSENDGVMADSDSINGTVRRADKSHEEESGRRLCECGRSRSNDRRKFDSTENATLADTDTEGLQRRPGDTTVSSEGGEKPNAGTGSEHVADSERLGRGKGASESGKDSKGRLPDNPCVCGKRRRGKEASEAMADTVCNRQPRQRKSRKRCGTPSDRERKANHVKPIRFKNQWITEPKLGRVAYGIPDRSHRLKSLGNGVVPQVVYFFGHYILEFVRTLDE